uniref:Protein kinase domain-containing protein n=1 Tax=Macrostomum lignano TaxID=282301 RepID=A0A1I8ISD4_9PLAT
ARAPKSIVIAIGQNLPPGEEFSVDELVSKWRSELDRTPGYPTVVEFLTLAEKPDDQAIARLRWTVLKWSLEVPCPDDVKRGRVIGRQLPMFFINAMELVVQRFEAIQGCHSAQRYVPLITEDEMLELLKEAAKNCEVPSQAFEKAIDFMHELGLLLHIRGDFNPSLFCPDAEWFLFVLQSVVLFKSTATLSQRGELQISQLKRFLTADLEMPESHTDTFLHLFHDLNICHKLNDKTLLFPNDLAERPTEPLDPEYVPRESLQPCRALLRVYRFPYFPPGLWPRLAARLHATVADLKERARFFYAGNRRRDQPRLLARQPSAASRLLYSSSIGAADSVQILSRSSRSLGGWERELLGKRTSICCWRRGFMVKHDDGRFGIQLGDSGVELELCVLSQSRNFAPIGLLVDEVDLLLDTWFPGLASFEEDGYADVAEDDGESNADEGLVGGATSGLMRRLVPCPECLSSLMDGGYVSLSALSERVPDWRAKVHWLGYRLCAERALTGRPLRCPRLVPELLFADVDRSAIVEAGRLRLRREPDCLLGEGAFGSVYRAWLGDTQVAAKISKFLENFVDQQQQQTDEPVKLRLQSGRRGSSSTRSLESAGATNEAPSAESAADSLVQLERARRLDQAIDGLKRMRHEANVLQALRSPFLVAFRGICLEPLCFLTELAPLGSLAEVREEARKQRPGTALPLGRQLSYKMAYEVITAVAYMHSLSVLYRDLKSDNVLVFSKDPAARLHVKLGDYGTSLNTGLQGTTGRQGTPGYMAPEVLRDCTYDEKVDVYSFGMVLYELICGERPFSKLPSSENLTKVVLDGGHPEFTVQEAEQAAFMGQLAQQCWRLSPGARPTAAGIRVAMETHSRWALERFIALPNDGAARTEAPVEAAAEERDGGGIPDFVGAMAEPTCACITESGLPPEASRASSMSLSYLLICRSEQQRGRSQNGRSSINPRLVFLESPASPSLHQVKANLCCKGRGSSRIESLPSSGRVPGASHVPCLSRGPPAARVTNRRQKSLNARVAKEIESFAALFLCLSQRQGRVRAEELDIRTVR